MNSAGRRAIEQELSHTRDNIYRGELSGTVRLRSVDGCEVPERARAFRGSKESRQLTRGVTVWVTCNVSPTPNSFFVTHTQNPFEVRWLA